MLDAGDYVRCLRLGIDASLRSIKMPFVVATYVYASSQGQRTHSARTNKDIDHAITM